VPLSYGSCLQQKIIKMNNYSNYKLLKHPERLKLWKEGKFMPILVDLELTNKCNHKCPLCVGSLNKDNAMIPLEKAKQIIFQLKEAGVKAIGLGGSKGDPTCHPHLAEIISEIKSYNIDVGVNTNGYEISQQLAESIIDCCTWVRISMDADSPEIYKKTHGMDESAFNQMLNNLRTLVALRKEKKSKIAIGVSYLIGPHTISGMFNASRIAKEIGVDYIRFRPFFNFENTASLIGNAISQIPAELKKCKEVESKEFSVSYSEDRCSSDSLTKKRPYSECYVQNFTISIAPDLKVYPCCILKNNPKYLIGDLSSGNFKEIWEGEKRKEIYKKTKFSDCPYPCMLEKHNEVLHMLKSQDPLIIDLLLASSENITHQNFL